VTLLRTLTGYTAVVNDLRAISEADVDWCAQGTYETHTAAPPGGTYPTTNDSVPLLFETTAGTQVKVTLVAPSSSIFMADGETVDPAMIATLIADVIGNVTDPAGNAVVSYIGGVLQKNKRDYS
jgi:hypothetical protein